MNIVMKLSQSKYDMVLLCRLFAFPSCFRRLPGVGMSWTTINSPTLVDFEDLVFYLFFNGDPFG